MVRSRNTIVFTGGGTAGHVFPAFPVLDRVKKAGYDVLWIGSKRGMERNLVEAAGIRYVGIPSGKLRRYRSFRNLTDLFRIVAGFWKSLRLLRRERPLLLFSKGGFVTVPPVAAARLVGVPSFTHESDVDPALSTRLNLRLGAWALVAYDETLDILPEAFRSRGTVVGNPVRDMMFHGDADRGRRLLGLSSEDERPLILVLGGSQGAQEVNELIYDCLEHLLTSAVVVHQTGLDKGSLADRPGYVGRPFFHEELPHLMAAAELVITRSGAGSIWELAATGTPGILLPLRKGTRGDQIRNAAMAEKRGLALTLEENAGADKLGRMIKELLGDPARLGTMASAAESFPARQAADRILNAIKERTA